MDKFRISGGHKLQGTVRASGSKNSALPLLFSTLLTAAPFRLSRVPHLNDIATTLKLLRGVGCEISHGAGVVNGTLKDLTSHEAPYELVRTMRASILMLGPLLARAKRAKVSLPGGCAIGTRPVDIHLSALEQLGASLRLESGYVVGECPGGLRGAEIHFRFPSVGATEHLLMAATLAKGETTLFNCAQEPEIEDLAHFLNKMGARIQELEPGVWHVLGVSELGPAQHEVMFDRIEAATLLLAGPITGGSVRVSGVNGKCLQSFFDILRNSGLRISQGDDWMAAEVAGGAGVSFSTGPHPGFATDLQAQTMAYLAQVEGESAITETIFENRFMHVPELNRLGADIRVEGSVAKVFGRKNPYQGAIVMATDLRASASLVLAGLAAKGETTVRRIYHLDRGYEQMEKKLQALGASIVREKDLGE
jgi:UDP-N-acetylglucosamine 1-carboxyvinyltransferase